MLCIISCALQQGCPIILYPILKNLSEAVRHAEQMKHHKENGALNPFLCESSCITLP